jgi:hypothetical protein
VKRKKSGIPGFFVDRMRQLDYINEEKIMEF